MRPRKANRIVENSDNNNSQLPEIFPKYGAFVRFVDKPNKEALRTARRMLIRSMRLTEEAKRKVACEVQFGLTNGFGGYDYWIKATMK